MIELFWEATTVFLAFVGVIVYLSFAAYFICFHGAKGYHRGKKRVLDEIDK